MVVRVDWYRIVTPSAKHTHSSQVCGDNRRILVYTLCACRLQNPLPAAAFAWTSTFEICMRRESTCGTICPYATWHLLSISRFCVQRQSPDEALWLNISCGVLIVRHQRSGMKGSPCSSLQLPNPNTTSCHSHSSLRLTPSCGVFNFRTHRSSMKHEGHAWYILAQLLPKHGVNISHNSVSL